jgi:DNA processing protein
MQARAEDWIDWLRLEQTPGVGNEKARKLLQAFGLPSQIFSVGYAALNSLVPSKIAHALSAPITDDILRQIELTASWCAQPGNRLICLADRDYPKALLDIPDPPILLYVKGRIDLLGATTIAVVGSRNASAQGISNAEQFSQSLSQAGISISSGLAAGIDAAAHQGALRGHGSTLAVIGTGIDIVYPARNRSLAHQIAEQGCIISEYALGTPAIASNFPRRNRIISGLAHGVLVVEAAAQSGSLITARMAAEQGREVFAIPGSIHSPLAKGCHQLIKQGAKLVETAQDILDELRIDQLPSPSATIVNTSNALSTDDSDDEFLTAIGYDPAHIDTLAERTGLDLATLSGQLLERELLGQIESLPGALYRRIG